MVSDGGVVPVGSPPPNIALFADCLVDAVALHGRDDVWEQDHTHVDDANTRAILSKTADPAHPQRTS